MRAFQGGTRVGQKMSSVLVGFNDSAEIIKNIGPSAICDKKGGAGRAAGE